MNVELAQLTFENTRFWAYFLSVHYPNSCLEPDGDTMYDLVQQVLPIDTDWSDQFTQYYDGVMEESDGYLDDPTTLVAPLDRNETLKIEFHPGDTVFFLNEEEIGCTGPHWDLQKIPFQRAKSLLGLEHGELLFQLLLPMVALERSETEELKKILGPQLLKLKFQEPVLSQAMDCLITGIWDNPDKQDNC